MNHLLLNDYTANGSNQNIWWTRRESNLPSAVRSSVQPITLTAHHSDDELPFIPPLLSRTEFKNLRGSRDLTIRRELGIAEEKIADGCGWSVHARGALHPIGLI